MVNIGLFMDPKRISIYWNKNMWLPSLDKYKFWGTTQRLDFCKIYKDFIKLCAMAKGQLQLQRVVTLLVNTTLSTFSVAFFLLCLFTKTSGNLHVYFLVHSRIRSKSFSLIFFNKIYTIFLRYRSFVQSIHSLILHRRSMQEL